MEEYDVELIDYLRVFWKGKWIILPCVWWLRLWLRQQSRGYGLPGYVVTVSYPPG